ncbi:hypothetical protein FOA52_005354 [Chlamydomonas sp. UWO 241]|nr:hypothetical protein FOA52_005354 [Chlamydomonas sp. UWO 241]
MNSNNTVVRGLGALEENAWPRREDSTFGIDYCVKERAARCVCLGTEQGGVVTPCPTNGGKFKSGEMMIWYGASSETNGFSTFRHLTCVSRDLAETYLFKDTEGNQSGYLHGMEKLEPSHAEWAKAYLLAVRDGDDAKAATLLKSPPKPHKEPAKKRAAGDGTDKPASAPKKPRTPKGPKEPKEPKAPKEPRPPPPGPLPLRPLKARSSSSLARCRAMFSATATSAESLSITLASQARACWTRWTSWLGGEDKRGRNTTALIVTEKKPSKEKLGKAIQVSVPRMSEAEFWDAYGTNA